MKELLKKYCNFFYLVIMTITLVFAFLFLMILTYNSLFSTTIFQENWSESTQFIADNPFSILIFMMKVLFIIILISKFINFNKKNDRNILFICMFVAVLVSLFFVLLLHQEPLADQATVLNYASMLNEDLTFSLKKGTYLATYPNNLGMTWILQQLLYWFNDYASLAFQIINVIAVGFIVKMLHDITDILFNNYKTNIITTILVTLFTPLMLYVTFIYGNLISMVLSLIALKYSIMFYQKCNFFYSIISAISILLAIIAKQNSLIILVAIIILYLCGLLKKLNIKFIFSIFIICLTYTLGMNYFYSYYEDNYHLDRDYAFPMISFVEMGISDNGDLNPGWYDSHLLRRFGSYDYDTEKMMESSIENINKRIEEFKKDNNMLFDFAYSKFVSQWNDPTFQSIWIQKSNTVANNIYGNNDIKSEFANDLLVGKRQEKYIDYMNILHAIISLGALLYVLLRIKRHEMNTLVLLVCVLGGFIFHMFWEAKGQYTLSYFILLIPYCAKSISILSDKGVLILNWLVNKGKMICRIIYKIAKLFFTEIIIKIDAENGDDRNE